MGTDNLNRIAVVTGASRGAGKGVALGLGQMGLTVYVTGRSTDHSLGSSKGEALPGTIHETAAEITRLGGRGIAVACDHDDDEPPLRHATSHGPVVRHLVELDDGLRRVQVLGNMVGNAQAGNLGKRSGQTGVEL